VRAALLVEMIARVSQKVLRAGTESCSSFAFCSC
jgi:hypothetical protein